MPTNGQIAIRRIDRGITELRHRVPRVVPPRIAHRHCASRRTRSLERPAPRRTPRRRVTAIEPHPCSTHVDEVQQRGLAVPAAMAFTSVSAA